METTYIFFGYARIALEQKNTYNLQGKKVRSDIIKIKVMFSTKDTTDNVNRISSVQSLSRVRLCDRRNRSTPGLPVLHQLPEFSDSRPSSQ